MSGGALHRRRERGVGQRISRLDPLFSEKRER
jgi:hypothetical protein